MFQWTYLRGELIRRRRRTTALVLGIAVGVALVVATNALAAGLLRSQNRALNPLSSVGSDLLVTRGVDQSHVSADDVAAMNAEEQQSEQASLLDLSKLGKPGTHFTQDFFLPASQLTFPAEDLSHLAHLVGVTDVAGSLTLQVTHRDGTVPTIVAQLITQPQTVTIAPLNDAERKAVNQCAIRTLDARSRPPAVKPNGSAFAQTLTPDEYVACLPTRFRQVAIQQQVITQIVNPPQTDFESASFQVSGVDTQHPDLGLLTRAQVVTGRYFSAAATHEVVLDTAFAQRRKLAVGRNFTLRGTDFTVVGLASPPLGGLTSDVYMSLGTLQQLAGRPGRVNTALLRVHDSAQVEGVASRASSAFPGAKVLSSRELASRVTGSLLDASRLASSVKLATIVIVLVATLGMAGLITLANVRRRIRELGTLRAIGWSRGRVVGQIILECVTQGIIAALAGLALGIAVALVAVHFAPSLQLTTSPLPSLPGDARSVRQLHQTVQLDAIFSVVPMLFAAGAAIVGGLLAGAMGSMRAARLGPMDALRELG